MTEAGEPYIDSVIAQGVPIIRSSKIANGWVVPQGNGESRFSFFLDSSRITNARADSSFDTLTATELIASGSLSPVKSRRMLQVLLALNKTKEQIRAAFEQPLGGYLTQF